VFQQTVNNMFSNTAQTQWDVHNSVSHSAFNVLNILMEIGYIKEWWPHIIRIIYTFLKLQVPECIQPKQSLVPLPPQHPPFTTTSLNHSQILCCCQEPAPPFLMTAEPHNNVQLSLWFLSSEILKKFPSFLVNHQILMHAADNIALWKTRITTKLIHHS